MCSSICFQSGAIILFMPIPTTSLLHVMTAIEIQFRLLMVAVRLGRSNGLIEGKFEAFGGDMSWYQFHILVQNLHLTSAVLNADLRCDDNNCVIECSVSLSLL